MLSPIKQTKFSYLFKILDFDHDGILQESDFLSVGENISIFTCQPGGSEIEEFILNRAKEIWKFIRFYAHTDGLFNCNLPTWLDLMDKIAHSDKEKFDKVLNNALDDIFYIFDKNDDKQLSKQEYLCFFVSLRVGIKQADFCFKSLDLDGDMRISREEMAKAIREFFLSDESSSVGNLLFGNPEIYKFTSRSEQTPG